MIKTPNKPTAPIALVTGGSGGLGQALVVELDRLGFRCAIHFNRDRASAEKLQANLQNESIVVSGDLGRWEQVEAMHSEVERSLGPVDVLINNAAIRKDGLMAMQSPGDWRAVIETNLLGPFHITRLTLPHMLRQRWGRVINIVSPSGIIATAGQTAYGSSKSGLIGFTRTLAAECGRRGVTVNAISPGMMDTTMTADLPARVRAGMLDRLPIPRFTSGAEVAAALPMFLDSDYMTGQVVSIDGGISIT